MSVLARSWHENTVVHYIVLCSAMLHSAHSKLCCPLYCNAHLTVLPTGLYCPAPQDPILNMATTISKSMWSSNPGYIVRDGAHMTSAFKTDFTYDQEEVGIFCGMRYMAITCCVIMAWVHNILSSMLRHAR